MADEFARLVDAVAQEMMSDRPDLLNRARQEWATAGSPLRLQLQIMRITPSPVVGYRGMRGEVLSALAGWRSAIEADEMGAEEALALAREKAGVSAGHAMPGGARKGPRSAFLGKGGAPDFIDPPVSSAPIGRPFTLWESRTITVGELLERIAESLYSDPLRQAGVVLNLREKVKRLAMQQAMPVRNSLSLEVLPVAAGDGLWNGVLFAKDAQRFAQEHGVPVTIRPHGSGPTHWTLELAAAEVGSRLGWHDGAIRTLVQRMVQAARAGDLRVRDPQTDLRIPSDPALLTKVREYYELVTRDDVNEWLASERAGYSWEGEAAGRGLEIPDPLRGLAEAAPSNLEQPVPHEAAASTRPPQRQRWQEERILATLRALGYEPCALPVPKLGSRDGPKARCRKALRSEDGESTWTDSVFDKAWERCRAASEIRDAD